MTFLSPWSAITAAALAVPLLLLLYFLKLRRMRLRVPSTMLWQRSYEDLQANVPFQRLRTSWLLLLQLLVLLLLALALGQPVLSAEQSTSPRVILLIDHSASMNATDVAVENINTRLDAAKVQARALIQRLLQDRVSRRIMIVSFAREARVVCGFTAQIEILNRALDSITQTDEPAHLEQALQLAGAFMQISGEGEADEQPPDVILFSDGSVGKPTEGNGFTLRAGQFRYIAVSSHQEEARSTAVPVNNLGIVSFSARRLYDDPQQVLVFVRLVNAGPDDINTLVTLYADDQPIQSRQILVPAAKEIPQQSEDDSLKPTPAERGDIGEVSLTWTCHLPKASLLSVQHTHRDHLATDDVAALVLREPRQLHLALVHPETGADPFLQEVLAATEPARLRLMSADVYEAAMIDSTANPEEEFDLIVFDRVSPPQLPNIPSLLIGAVPPDTKVVEESSLGGKRILSWDRQHPLLRHVSLDTVRYTDFGGYILPQSAVPLVYGTDGPLIAVVKTPITRHVAVGFPLIQSNWPLHVSFTVFIQNVFDYLTLGEADATGRTLDRSADGNVGGWGGSVRARSDVDEIRITGPQSFTISAEPGSLVVLPQLRQVGVYTVEGAMPPHEQLAVSLLSEEESDIRPRPNIMVNAQRTARGSIAETAPYQLWSWFAAAAGLLVLLEWLVYCKRMAQ